MQQLVLQALVIGIVCGILAGPAHALPTFQVYIDKAVAGTIGTDEETWFGDTEPFTLIVVGAYGPHTTSLTDATLVLSIPEGESGTVQFSNLGDGTPSLLTVAGGGSNPNPSGNANEDHLTDVAGLDGYNAVSNFKPSGLVFPPHAPTGDDASDFILYSLGSFGNSENHLKDYNAGDGTITTTSATGEQKEYGVTIGGFSRVHFDLYGFETVSRGGSGGWAINPGSHDSTWRKKGANHEPVVPEPSSITLMSIGLGGLACIRRRRRQ